MAMRGTAKGSDG
uniref:Uncharacterized protein n=1 Tax=Arundo donax TaxID=35708 RepID=A0A0A8YJZ3_ARUDO